MSLLIPKPTDRFVVLGPTGSGKTFLVRDMLARVELSDPDTVNIIVDFKGEWEARPQDRVATSLRQLEHEMDDERRHPRGFIIYRVPDKDLDPRNAGELDKVAYLALEAEWTRVYYDDLIYVAKGSDFYARAPYYYRAVVRGRSIHVPIWGAIQRPAWVPIVALSESDVRASFYLRRRADRATAEELLGEAVPWNVLKKERYTFVMGDDRFTTSVNRLSDRTVRKAA